MRYRFAPRWPWVLLTAAMLPLFISLGFWQWQRGQARQVSWDQFERNDTPAIEAPAASLAGLPRYTRVRLRGEFDGERQFLLDNISHQGAPGYEVLTVLRLPDGSRLLVNRGWLPFSGYRDRLPDVSLPGAAAPDPAAGPPAVAVISGRLAQLPVSGLASGRAPPALDGGWPRLTSFPEIGQLAEAYGAPLLPVVLLLDADSGPGYLRQWQPPGLPPARHIGYAVQWWAFALLAAGLLVGFNLKRSDD